MYCRRFQSNQAQVLFLLQDGARFALKIRRNDHFAENFADYFRKRLGQGTVAHDYPAKGRLFVRGKRLVPRLAKIGIRADTAGIGMFQDPDGWLLEFGNQIRGGADVENVVKGEFLAV